MKNIIKRTVDAGLMGCLVILLCWSAADANAQGMNARMQGQVIADGTELNEILLLLQDESGLQFVLDQGVNPKVTFKLDSPTVREILDQVLPSAGLDYLESDGGAIRIGPAAVIAELKREAPELITKTLQPQNVDVADIFTAIESARSEYGSLIQDFRNNQILVEDTPDSVAKMLEILYQLDQAVETRVFNVDYGDIAQIEDELRKTLQLEDTNIIVDERSGQLIIKAPIDILNRAEALIEQLDIETEIRIFPLKFADYELIDGILDLIEPELSENGRAELDERTLRLIVIDTPARLDRIAELIRRLDTPTLQVYLEVEIVSIQDDHESSFDFKMSFGEAVGTDDETLSSATDAVSFPLSFDPFLTTGSSGLTLFHVQKGDFRVQLDALVSENKAEIIASPRILVQDDFPAFFNLGSEEPYSVQSRYGGYGSYGYSGYSSGYSSQRTRDVGTILDIVPHISEAGYVDMEIVVEDSTPRREEIGNDQIGLAVDKTEIETRVTVKAGRTIVLGGLVRSEKSDTRAGVPILSKIPFLGAPFRRSTNNSNKDKMLIFITPILVNVDDPYDFAVLTPSEEIERLQLGQSGEGGVGAAKINPRLLDWSSEENNEGDFFYDADPRNAGEAAVVPNLPPLNATEETSPPKYGVIGDDDSPIPGPSTPAQTSPAPEQTSPEPAETDSKAGAEGQ